MKYVTGATGFIGSSLVKKLGSDVVAIPHKDIHSFKLTDFDEFYFCSSYGNLADQTDDDDEILKANITDLVDISVQLPQVKFNSFTWISSSSVKLPIQTMYSRCKRAGEEILLSFIEKYHLPICIIRPFSVTGVGEQSKHLIPVLINAAVTGNEINFVPQPSHDFIDIDDLTNGILNLAKNRAKGIFELGTGKEYTNQQVKELVEEVIGNPIRVNIVNQIRSYDTKSWVSTNFKARSWGWLPTKSLEVSIREMHEKYLNENYFGKKSN